MQNLILLHGALGTKEQVAPLIAILSDTFNIYSFNFQGHGGRAATADYAIATFADDVVQFMNENKLDKAHFFGYSMGGYVAIQLAKTHPHLVLNVVTLGTKFDWTPEVAAKEIKMLNPDVIEQKVPAFAQMLEKAHHPLDWKAVMQKTAKMMHGLGNGKSLTSDDFKNIQHHILINRGSLDRMVSQEESQTVVNLLPNATFQTIEGFKHPIDRIDYTILAKVIKQFL